MHYAFLHGVGEEVDGLGFYLAVLVPVVLPGGWRVFLVDITRHGGLPLVSDCLGGSEVLVVTAKLGIAVLDESALAGVEHGALVVSAISSGVTCFGCVYFLRDVWHLIPEVSFVCPNVDLIVLTSFNFVSEEISWFSKRLAVVRVPRVGDLRELVGIAQGGC